MTREADVADFARLFGLLNCLHGPTGGEDDIRIVETNDFMELQQIDHICLQAAQRLLNLPGSGVLISAIDLCHQEDLLPVTIAERLPHPDLADAAVIIPAIIHEGDTVIDCGAKQTDAPNGILLFPDVVTAHADRRNPFACAAKLAINHVRRLRSASSYGRRGALRARSRNRSRGHNGGRLDRKSTRLTSSHLGISY